jgi:hypothetical protein
LRAARALAADLLLPTRVLAFAADGSLAARFDAAFALDAGPILFVFDFVVFFDLLRAAIGQLHARPFAHALGIPCANTASSKQQADFLSTK